MPAFTNISTRFGDIGIIYEAHPFKLSNILFPPLDRSGFLDPSVQNSDSQDSNNALHEIKQLIRDYECGTPICLTDKMWESFDFSGFTPLQKQVYIKTSKIPFGATVSYSDLAKAIGRGKAYRFVGTTMAHNPFPLLIPCHRIIRSSGQIGKFGGGSDLKKKLIDFEKYHSSK